MFVDRKAHMRVGRGREEAEAKGKTPCLPLQTVCALLGRHWEPY